MSGNSQNSNGIRASIAARFCNPEQSISSARSLGRSLKRTLFQFSRRPHTESTLSLPLPSSTENLGRVCSLDPSDDPPPANAESNIKDLLKLTGRFLQTLITKLPEIVDGNPAKVVLGLAKAILEIKDTVEGNKDTVIQRIKSTAGQLNIMEEALDDWNPSSEEERRWRAQFETALDKELKELIKLKDGSIFRRILDHEDEQKRIATIFERINDTRIQFELATGIRVSKIVHEIQEELRLDRLKASPIADHKYHLEGKEREVLRRAVCTTGTRVGIVDDIINWANDASTESPSIYWLFGPAGSGKSTIAYTIARRFELAPDAADKITLGGNFFCSRQFEETRQSKYIVRTIAYHLALRSKQFANALGRSGKFDTINQKVTVQLQYLLIEPWQSAQRPDPSTPPVPDLPMPSANCLIVIDALDEIDGNGGSEFLNNLVNVLNKHRLRGLKFFVTSRPDPDLVTYVEKFDLKHLYRLQDVEKEEVNADIRKYLSTSLPETEAGCKAMEEVVKLADGLFIYAATVLKYLDGYMPNEKVELLIELLSKLASPNPQTPASEISLLNGLYRQILESTFPDLQVAMQQRRLQLLHTFLCAAERTSTTVAANLLCTSNNVGVYIEGSNAVLGSLHAVLYAENDKVLWYHKSFPDFLFDRNQSNEFWCDEGEHHRLLTNACFRVMKDGLQFNMAGMASSFDLDSDNATLLDDFRRNIPSVLSYSNRNWSYHLSEVRSIDSDPLLETLSEFLELRVLFWIEAMNLLKSCGRCDRMLQTAREWVIKARDSSPLAEHLSEAGSFALYFSGSPASSSTPHLYISALATWPQKSNAWCGWKRHFPGIPGFINASLGGTVLMTLKMDSSVAAVAISKDGRSIVAGCGDQSVRVWDASTGEEQKVLKGHTISVESVAFSNDGRRIVSGSRDKSVRVWDVSTGEEQNVLKGHTNLVTSVAFSNNDRRIVSGSYDKSLRVWDASTGEEQNVLEGHTSSVYSVAFSSDGRRIVSGSGDQSVRVWDASTGEEQKVLKVYTSVYSVAFSSDGRCIVSGSRDKSVRVWDASTGEEQKVLKGHTKLVTSVAFSNNDRHIVSGSYDYSVRVWDASTGEEQKVLKGHTSWVNSVAFSSDGRRIVSGSGDQSVRVWDASTGEEQEEQEGHTSLVNSVAFSSDGRRIVSGSDDQSVRVWDASTGEEQIVLEGHTSSVMSVAFSSDGRRIVSGSEDKSLRMWDASTGEEQKVLEGHTSSVNSVAFSSDGMRIVSGSEDNSVRLWDALTGKEENVLKGHTHSVRSVAFSSDGRRIVSGSSDDSVRVWDALTGEEQKVLEGHTSSVYSIAFSSDGRRIVSGSFDLSVRVWDTSTGEEQKVLEGHTSPVNSVAFSSDGMRIVSGSNDQSAWVWDASTGEVLKVLKGHTSCIKSVAFSSDGRRIVSGSYDNSVRVWDVSTGEEQDVLEGYTSSIFPIPFSSDERSNEHKSVVPRYIREEIPNSTHYQEHSGWLLSPHDGREYLIFVPPSERLPDDANILTIPRSFISYVDFTGSRLGPQWRNCYFS